MKVRADKAPATGSQSVVDKVPCDGSGGKAVSAFVDNRPVANVQRELQSAVNSSPRVNQLRNLREELSRSQIELETNQLHAFTSAHGANIHSASGRESYAPTNMDASGVAQRHKDFHSKVDDDAKSKAHSYGPRTVHHKISQAYLIHLTDALTAALNEKSTKEAAADFQAALLAARHSHVQSTDIFTMLNNMPINLEVGPDQGARKADPGSGFDGNTEPDDEVSDGPGRPRLRRRLTARSLELRKINTIIENNVLPRQSAVTADQWRQMATAVRAAVAAHRELTNSQHNTLSDPKEEQWERLPKGLFAKKKTDKMEQEYLSSDKTPLDEAAAHKKQREKEEAKQRRLKIQRDASERQKIQSAKLKLQNKLLGITKRNYTSKNIEAIYALLPDEKDFPTGIKAITKDDISPSGGQIKEIRKKRNKYGAPSDDPVGDAKRHIDGFKSLIGLVVEDDAAVSESGGDSTPWGVHQGRWSTFLELVSRIDQVADAQMLADAMEVANSQYAGPTSTSTEKPPEETSDDDHEPKGYRQEMFETTANVGGGDCLFHALYNRNLPAEELLAIRAEVSQRVGVHNHVQELINAHVTAALDQTGADIGMVIGRDMTEEAYAALQATPGVYAGDDELRQWCAYVGQRVVVVEETGVVSSFTGDGRVEVSLDEDNTLRQVIEHAPIALYKTTGHYVRINSMR